MSSNDVSMASTESVKFKHYTSFSCYEFVLKLVLHIWFTLGLTLWAFEPSFSALKNLLQIRFTRLILTIFLTIFSPSKAPALEGENIVKNSVKIRRVNRIWSRFLSTEKDGSNAQRVKCSSVTLVNNDLLQLAIQKSYLNILT